MIGDLCKTKNKHIEENFDDLVMLLILNLENSPTNRNDPNDVDKIHICSNSCWAIGLLSAVHSQKLTVYIDQIMERLLKMLCVPRVNLINNISLTNPSHRIYLYASEEWLTLIQKMSVNS